MARKISPANPLPYLIQRENGNLHCIKTKLFDERLRVAKNLFKTDLIYHYGCVNAIEFSDDGELLLSGGDDRRVILWRFGETLLDRGEPEPMDMEHLSNIFCLAITSDKTRIYSGGNDDRVIVHDTETKQVVEMLPHQKAVCGVSIDPYNSQVIATAGNDGRLLVFDTRQSVDESLVLSRSRKAYQDVEFHPSQYGWLAAANAQEGTTLWDIRKAKDPLMRYGGPDGNSQNSMSVRFDTLGVRLLSLRRRLPPVLYMTDTPEPRMHFYHPDYYNSCTMKGCCFAGDKDQFVLSGSDDFNLYMWMIPDKEGIWVNDSHVVLHGHRSVVNQVRYNSQYGVIASSGIEKVIKTWSPIEILGACGSLLEERPENELHRTLYSNDEYVSLDFNGEEMSNREDPQMMAFFDSLVQREIDSWSAEASDSSDSEQYQPPLIDDDSDNHLADFKPMRRKDSRAWIARQVQLQRAVQRPFVKSQQGERVDRRVRKILRKPRGNTSLAIGWRRRQRTHRALAGRSSSEDRTEVRTRRTRAQGSKMSRANRRRMNMPRIYDRKTKGFRCYRGKGRFTRKNAPIVETPRSHLENPNLTEDTLAVPSTSTGIRNSNGAPIFRITEADSDDDQSIESPPYSGRSKPHATSFMGIIPTPLIGAYGPLNLTTNRYESSQTPESQYSNYSYLQWDEGVSAYTPALGRLQNKTNESEVESNCSTAEDSTSPIKLRTSHIQVATPDSGIHTEGPSGSSDRQCPTENAENSDDIDWVVFEYRQRAKRARRQYRRHHGDSDST